ncbi:hypothetical protein BGZ46_007521 [Entomortierella lignicola]|nr:hypothetical protein BGZ46_007521 [Entomortierella lignicola]
MERVFAISELCANIISFLRPKQIRRLRLVSKQLYDACTIHMRISLILNSRTPSNLISDPSFPANLITSLRLDAIDQVSPLFINIVQNCPRISSLEINDFGLDIYFLQETLRLGPLQLQRLAVRSDGFVTMESLVEIVVSSEPATHIRMLSLDTGHTGLEETHSLSWPSFRSMLDTCTSLSALSLAHVKIMDVPESLEETNTWHATTMTFPNMISLTLNHCDISEANSLVRLLRMFPNLKNLEMSCRDAMFYMDHSSKDNNSLDISNENSDNAKGVDDPSLCANLRNVSVRCTNIRSQADQEGLYLFLMHLPSIKTIELMGLGINSQTLLRIAQAWTRRGIQLKRLRLDFNRRRAVDDGLDIILRQGCCSRLEIMDVYCDPSLISTFWNEETHRSELPFLETLQGLHLRKDYENLDRRNEIERTLNLTLKQMPKLVDMTIAARLDDYSIFQGMGREPEVQIGLPDAPITTTGTDWSQERPFLQTLAIGCSSEFYSNRIKEMPRQIAKRFRFLEDFQFIV